MVTPELTDYIQNRLAAGVPVKQLRSTLVKAGWQKEDVNAALAESKAAGVKEKKSSAASAAPAVPHPISQIITWILTFLLLAAIIGGGAYIYLQKQVDNMNANTPASGTPVPLVVPTATIVLPLQTEAPSSTPTPAYATPTLYQP